MTGVHTTRGVRMAVRALLRVGGSTALVAAATLTALAWRGAADARARAAAGLAPAAAVTAPFTTPIVLAACGCWLLVLDGVLLRRWVTPAAGAGCPSCGYDLRGLRSNVCPECGAAVGPGAA